MGSGLFKRNVAFLLVIGQNASICNHLRVVLFASTALDRELPSILGGKQKQREDMDTRDARFCRFVGGAPLRRATLLGLCFEAAPDHIVCSIRQ